MNYEYAMGQAFIVTTMGCQLYGSTGVLVKARSLTVSREARYNLDFGHGVQAMYRENEITPVS